MTRNIINRGHEIVSPDMNVIPFLFFKKMFNMVLKIIDASMVPSLFIKANTLKTSFKKNGSLRKSKSG